MFERVLNAPLSAYVFLIRITKNTFYGNFTHAATLESQICENGNTRLVKVGRGLR